MIEKEYFSHLYEIASHLNKEFSLPSALRISLEKTVELLGLDTGWIWLVEKDNKTIYLAATYNLPPALSKHPERLSGWCYCIENYLSDDISEATNISEITCSRLKDIRRGTRNLKYHACVPIITQNQKVGLINLVSKETQELTDKQLSILNTVGELIGIAIQRTRLQEIYSPDSEDGIKRISEILSRVIQPKLDSLTQVLNSSEDHAHLNNPSQALKYIKESKVHVEELNALIHSILIDSYKEEEHKGKGEKLQYPASPLTRRELEVLSLVRKGLTNSQIAGQLFIVERTVKFHISSILSKLYASTRTEAVNIALQRGLLSA